MSWLNGGVKCDLPSRGYYEEDNIDEEITTRSYHLDFDFKQYAGSLKLLIVTTSNLSKQFVGVYLSPINEDKLNADVGQITEKETLNAEKLVEPKSQNSDKILVGRIVARFFKISESVLHCHIPEELCPEDVNKFTGELLSLDCPRVSKNLSIVVLSSDHLSSYQCCGEDRGVDNPLQRCLISPSALKLFSPPCKRLEQPNVIKGVAAAVLTACTFSQKHCLMLLNYTDSQKADSITLSGFSSLFNVNGLLQLLNKVSNKTSLDRLKKLQSRSTGSENIFM